MNQLSYYVTKRLIVGSKDSSGTIIHKFGFNFPLFLQQVNQLNEIQSNCLVELNEV